MNRRRNIIRINYNEPYESFINNKLVSINETNDLTIEERNNFNNNKIKIKQIKVSSQQPLNYNDFLTYINNLFNSEETNLNYTYQVFITDLLNNNNDIINILNNNNDIIQGSFQTNYFNKFNFRNLINTVKFIKGVDSDEIYYTRLRESKFLTFYIYVYVNNMDNLILNRSGLNNINLEDENNLLNDSGLNTIYNNLSFDTAKEILRDRLNNKLNKLNNLINKKQKLKNYYTQKKDTNYTFINNLKYRKYKNYNKIVELNRDLLKLTRKYKNIQNQINKIK